MLRSRHSILALTLLVAVGACSDSDDGTSPDQNPLDALVGSYTTQSFVYTAHANAELTTGNLVQAGFGITTLTLAAAGTFSGELTLPIAGVPTTLQITGNVSDVTATSLTINFDPPAGELLTNPLPVTYTLTGDVLSFSANNVNFDYSIVGGPSGDVPSLLEMVLLRS